MKVNLYVIKDELANSCSMPFCSESDELAKRQCLYGCFESMVSPMDITLYKIGSFKWTKENETNSEVFSLSSLIDGVTPCRISITEEDVFKIRKIYNGIKGIEEVENEK